MDKPVKQVIVMRNDLKVRKGKSISQGCHASISFLLKKPSLLNSKQVQAWIESGTAKIVVRVESEEELLDIYNQAKTAGLEVNMITDSGRTEFNGVPTKTCLAIGPDYEHRIDPITGKLKLL